MSEQINDLVQHALDQDYNKANKVFGELMTVKLSDVLDQEKIKLADQIYNGIEDSEEEKDEDQLELDLEKEEDSEESEESEEDEEDEEEENESDEDEKDADDTN